MKMIRILLALAVINIAGLAQAWGTEWTRWGMDPYASSDIEAIRKLPDALLAMNVPEPVRVLFLEAVEADPEGDVMYLNPGDRYEAMMWTPGGDVRTDIVVGRHPVRRGVVESAEARGWRVEYEGRAYVLVLPEICFNWAWRSEPLPMPERVVVVPTLECAEIAIADAQPGDRLSVAVLARGPLPPSECWAVGDGRGNWEDWPGECVECPWTYAQSLVHPARTQVRRSGRVTVASRGVVIRVPILVAERDFVALCMERQRRRSCTYVVEPSDFGGRRGFSLPDWEWTGCPGEVRRR